MRPVRLCEACGRNLSQRSQATRHPGCPSDDQIVQQVEAAMGDPTTLAGRTASDFILPVRGGMISIMVEAYKEISQFLPPNKYIYIGTYGPFEIVSVHQHQMLSPEKLQHISISFQNTSTFSGIFFPAGTNVTQEIPL